MASKRVQGFTLAELVIVIVVIAILAAVVTIAYNGVTQRTREASALDAAGKAGDKAKLYLLNNSSRYPSDLATIEVTNSASTTYQYTVDNTSNPRTFCVTVIVDNKVSAYLSSAESAPQLGVCPGHLAAGEVPSIDNHGVVTTLTGADYDLVNGTLAAARFGGPKGIAVAPDGTIYVVDTPFHHIRKITTGGTVSIFAGTLGIGYAEGAGTTAAKFRYPAGVAVASDGTLYVADVENFRIRKITTSGVASTYAGDGYPGSADGASSSAEFFYAQGVAVAPDGTVYVADTDNHTIRKISGGNVTTLAGVAQSPGNADGTGAAASFYKPQGITVGSDGTIYVADTDNNRIRKITPAGVVTTLAGQTMSGMTDGNGTSAQFNRPSGIAVDTNGTVYVVDQMNNRIRKITPSGDVTTLAGSTSGANNGTGTAAQFNEPWGIAITSDGTLYVSDMLNSRIRKLR